MHCHTAVRSRRGVLQREVHCSLEIEIGGITIVGTLRIGRFSQAITISTTQSSSGDSVSLKTVANNQNVSLDKQKVSLLGGVSAEE